MREVRLCRTEFIAGGLGPSEGPKVQGTQGVRPNPVYTMVEPRGARAATAGKKMPTLIDAPSMSPGSGVI